MEANSDATRYMKHSDHQFEAQVAQFLANIGPVKTALGLPNGKRAALV